MAKTVSIVFSQPPPGAAEDDFNAWYDEHLHEMLTIPGFVAAQRFRIEPEVVDPDAPAPSYSYVALFEFEGDPAAMTAEKERARLSTKESYVELKKTDSSGPALPDWWDDVRFASWNCVAIGSRVETTP